MDKIDEAKLYVDAWVYSHLNKRVQDELQLKVLSKTNNDCKNFSDNANSIDDVMTNCKDIMKRLNLL